MNCFQRPNICSILISVVFSLSVFAQPVKSLRAQENTTRVGATAKSNQAEFNSATRLYLKVLRAEQALVAAKLQQETDRWAILKGLRQRGHASWMEVRTQQLRKEKLAASHQAYQDFIAEIESNLSRIIPAGSLTVSHLGRLAFTELFVVATDNLSANAHPDLVARCNQYRDAISQRAESVENLKRQLRSLQENDPWKPGFQHRVAVAERELNSIKARLQLTTHFLDANEGSVESNVAHQSSTRLPGSISLSQVSGVVKQSLLKHCQLHGELLAEIAALEKARLAKLKILQAKEMITQRDMNSLVNRVAKLETSVQKQKLVSQNLDLLLQPSYTKSGSPTKVRDTDSASKAGLKNWQDVRKTFSAYEAKVQARAAQLEKEMLSQVLDRLEKAWAQSSLIDSAVNDSGSTKFSNSLRLGQQVEMDYYRHKIRLADLQFQLADARLQTLESQHAQQFYAVLLEPKTQVALTNWICFFSPRTISSSVSHPGNTSSTSIGQLSKHIDDGPWSNYPTQFLGLESSYRPLKLNDYARPLRVSRSSSLLRPSQGPLSYFNRSTHKPQSSSYSNRRDYESIGLTKRRSSKTLERAYQYGIIKPEYRGLLNPSQTPWYFPGSPNNLRPR